MSMATSADKFSGWHGLDDLDIDRLARDILKKRDVGRRYYDEALSSAYLAAVRASVKFNPNRRIKFSTYVCEAIHNEISKMFAVIGRREKWLPTESSDPEEGPTLKVDDPKRVDPSESAIRSERIEAVRSAVAKLPSEYAEFFRLTLDDGMTEKRAAAAIGLNKDWLWRKIPLAQKFLRSELEHVA